MRRNILTKSDLGANAAYAYQSSGSPHALCGVSDVTTDWGLERQDIAYTDFGKVKSIDEGSHSCRIGYLPDGQRGYMTLSDGRTSTTRFYGDSYELFRDTLGNTSYIYYLNESGDRCLNLSDEVHLIPDHVPVP